MAKFLSAQATAAALIAKNGSKVQLRRRVVNGFDPVTQFESVTDTTYDFFAVVIPPSQANRYKVNLEGKNAVEVYFSLKGQAIRPEPGDILVAGGEEWRLFWSQTYDPALDGAIFTLAFAER